MERSIFRRAALDEQVKNQIRQKVRELLNQKSDDGGGSNDGASKDESSPDSEERTDRVMQNESGTAEEEETVEDNGSGEIYLFDEEEGGSEESRDATASLRVAIEFKTKKEYEKYKKNHDIEPGTKIKILEKNKGPSKKEDEPKERGPAKDDDDGKGKAPAKEDEKGKVPAKEDKDKAKGAPAKKEDDQSQVKEVDKEGPTTQDSAVEEEKPQQPEKKEVSPAKVEDKGSRQIAIKDKLIDMFGVDAKNWNVHGVHSSQLTKDVVIKFPDGAKKRYEDLSTQEQERVHKALEGGLAAHKGINDYTKVDMGTVQKNMANNLSRYDDESVEEPVIDDSSPLTKDNVQEFTSSIRTNGRAVVNKYRSAMSRVSRPMLEHHIEKVADSIQEGVKDGSLANVSQSDLDEFIREDIKRMIHQETETRRRSLGDHGIRHLAGNTKSCLNVLDELQQGGIPITGKQKFMSASIMANHDLGYTVGTAATSVSKQDTGKHTAQSKQLAEQEKGRYEKVFGKEDAQKAIDIIGTHDTNDIDWEADPVGSAVRLADNTSLFGNDKVQDLFIRSPKALNEACKLRLAAESGDKDLQASIKKNLHSVIEEDDFDDFDKEDMHRQVDEMSEEGFSTTKDILSRFSGKLEGFKYDADKKIVNVNMKYSTEGQMIESLFGDSVAAKQFDKFAKDLGADKVKGRRGKTTFKNKDGKAVFQMNISGIDKEPIQSASTGAMREFEKHTVRSDLGVASRILTYGRDTEKAKKRLEKAKDKFSEEEWGQLSKAMDEGSKGDLGVLAKKLEAWPLTKNEQSYMKGKSSSLSRIAYRVTLAEIGDRLAMEMLAARGQQVRRKDKDLMSDTGGTSKIREREPTGTKPPREENKKPWRTKDKPSEQRETDTDNDKDKAKVRENVASYEGAAKSELARYPKRFVEAVMRG